MLYSPNAVSTMGVRQKCIGQHWDTEASTLKVRNTESESETCWIYRIIKSSKRIILAATEYPP